MDKKEVVKWKSMYNTNILVIKMQLKGRWKEYMDYVTMEMMSVKSLF